MNFERYFFTFIIVCYVSYAMSEFKSELVGVPFPWLKYFESEFFISPALKLHSNGACLIKLGFRFIYLGWFE